jgi:hypothetical protein
LLSSSQAIGCKSKLNARTDSVPETEWSTAPEIGRSIVTSIERI